MITLNVMELAWKLYRANPLVTKFYYSLKLAWKIIKQSSVTLIDNTIEFKSKTISKMKLYCEHLKSRTKIIINNDLYTLNIFASEMKVQL